MSDKSQSGIIRISDDVISIIAGLAALDTPGIASMSGGISEGLTKRMSGKSAKKGVFSRGNGVGSRHPFTCHRQLRRDDSGRMPGSSRKR